MHILFSNVKQSKPLFSFNVTQPEKCTKYIFNFLQ